MGVFRTLIKSYRKVKDAKNECCENLLNSLHELAEEARIAREESNKEGFEEFKELFFAGKITTNYKTTRMLMRGEITSELYKIEEKLQKFMIQKLINDVESKIITHREFFKELESL